MSRKELIDPEVRVPLDQLLEALPGGFNAIEDIVQRRATVEAILAGIEVPDNPNVIREDRTVPGPQGEPDISVRIYRPRPTASPTTLDRTEGSPETSGPRPGIFFIHGGGMILGNVAGEDAVATLICDQVGAVVVSVEYRLAPENPHPAPAEDCYAGLRWMAEHADELGVDPDRLGVYGGSAGGGLAIAVALMARDRGGPALACLMPIYPMIDDRNETASSHEITDIGIWDRAGNEQAWAWYLGGKPADQYAAPARAEDLSGLPPSFIDVGTVDLFRDEDIAFAQRLMQAGVPTELHVHPGSYHAAETFAVDAALSKRIWAMRVDALRRFLRS
jgi:acetyl esterase/lipase